MVMLLGTKKKKSKHKMAISYSFFIQQRKQNHLRKHKIRYCSNMDFFLSDYTVLAGYTATFHNDHNTSLYLYIFLVIRLPFLLVHTYLI